MIEFDEGRVTDLASRLTASKKSLLGLAAAARQLKVFRDRPDAAYDSDVALLFTICERLWQIAMARDLPAIDLAEDATDLDRFIRKRPIVDPGSDKGWALLSLLENGMVTLAYAQKSLIYGEANDVACALNSAYDAAWQVSLRMGTDIEMAQASDIVQRELAQQAADCETWTTTQDRVKGGYLMRARIDSSCFTTEDEWKILAHLDVVK